MKSEHTPGPWKCCSVKGGWDGVKPANSNLEICNLVENNPANARLIAAAPEMLEILIDFIKIFKAGNSPKIPELYSVVEKATGVKVEDILD